MSLDEHSAFLGRVERTIASDTDMILMAGTPGAVDVYMGGGLGKIDASPGERLGAEPAPLFARSGPDALQAFSDVTSGMRDRVIYIAVYASVVTGQPHALARDDRQERQPWPLAPASPIISARWTSTSRPGTSRRRARTRPAWMAGPRARSASCASSTRRRPASSSSARSSLGFVAFAVQGGCNDVVHATRDVAVGALTRSPSVLVDVQGGQPRQPPAQSDSLVTPNASSE